MKRWILLTLLITPTWVWAQQEGEMLAKVKAEFVEAINKRIANLEKEKVCVQGAADQKALRACHQETRESMKQLQEDTKTRRRELREEFKERRKEMRENRKEGGQEGRPE